MSDLEAVLEAPLEQLRTMLGPDGYDLKWRQTGPEAVQLEVVAGAEACEDCLVPKAVMESIVAKLLTPTGVTATEIVYPTEVGG